MVDVSVKEVITGLIVAFLVFVGSKLQSASTNYYRFFNKRITENEYKSFVAILQDRNELIVLFLDKISRCIAIAFLNLFGVLVIFSPGFAGISYNIKYPTIVFLTGFMFLLVFFAISKPINFYYATKDPEKYKNRVMKKLGKLPDEPGVSTPVS